ncbi:cyclin-domain-containing protein [Jimgerdemannia flammicorona]|uniref:Cyclin-domain-containing protein n=1 Tax=Jimgerdemannia flammicorona TaxID=994334 RepID=A0A433D0L3_9FUNG|nr:cyclin-domain-containing protein [Jimgerdemannia flammicorona]
MAPAEQLSFASDVYTSKTSTTSSSTSTPTSRITQLADFCSFVVPCIWYGGTSSQYPQTRNMTNFRKFCYDILNATQISSSCILLSLKYIQSLKRQNPNIRGAEGSEYRLFTVALMLANKYLDDNTYTNKTWAEVSNLSVKELNIMEIEYLAALSYELFVSEQEYLQWLKECETYVARQGQYMQQQANATLRPTKVPTGVRRLSPPPPSRNHQLPSINMSNFMPAPTAMTIQHKRQAHNAFVDTSYEPPLKRVNVYGVQPQRNVVLPNTPPHYGGGYVVPVIAPIPTYPQTPVSPAYTPPSCQQYYAAPMATYASLPDYVTYNASNSTLSAPIAIYPTAFAAQGPLVDRTNFQYYNTSNTRRGQPQTQMSYNNPNIAAFSSDFTFQSATVM